MRDTVKCLLFAWSIIYDHLNKGKTQGGAAKEALGEGFGNGAAGPLGSLMEGLGKLPWPHIGLPCLCPANKKSLAPPLPSLRESRTHIETRTNQPKSMFSISITKSSIGIQTFLFMVEAYIVKPWMLK